MKMEAPKPLFERYARVSSLRELLACVREYDETPAPPEPGGASIRLAITGNCSTQFLAKAFPLALAARGLQSAVYESSYNQWQIDTLDPASALYDFVPTHVLLTLSSIELAYGSLRTPQAVIDAIAGAAERLLSRTGAQVFITLPEPLPDEITDWSSAYGWRREVDAGLRLRLGDPRITLVDLEPLLRTVGAATWFDDRFYETAKLPFRPDCTPLVLARLGDAIAGQVTQRCKLVIVDLDDTLWGGRVGEDGWEGIELDPAGPGRHFLRLQFFLRGLLDQGVVLAIASKNHPEPVVEAFSRRTEMLLKYEDFVTAEIHWEPKSLSVQRILDRLNLSTAGVVFLDDNPVERAEVCRKFPDIVIPELPENPAERVSMLLSSGIFDRRVVTEESRNRTEMYRENDQRDRVMRGADDLDDFLRKLDMEMEVVEVIHARERVLELIHKTNQFNLTTRRYNWDELLRAIDPGFGVCYRLKDRFGDNGIISVVLVALSPDASAHIDLWLMSCRVLGRQVEEAILVDIATRAKELGARKLVGEYVPTTKNKLVCDLYPRLGFDLVDDQPKRVTFDRPLDRALPESALIRVSVRSRERR